jgi:hypothetical protein
MIIVLALAVVLVALLGVFAIASRNPALERRAAGNAKKLLAYRLLVHSLQKRLQSYADTDPVAASLLDDINAVINNDDGITREVTRGLRNARRSRNWH